MNNKNPIQVIIPLSLFIVIISACPDTKNASTKYFFLPTPIPTSAFVLPTPANTASPTVAPVGFPRRFHVESNALVDQYGQKMIFRGMAPIDPVLQALGGKPEYGVWSEHHYRVMAEWGANIIRLPIVPDNLHAHSMEEILRVLDQTIAWAAQNKMYIIIDFHAIGWPPDGYSWADCDQTSPQEIMEFWNVISRRYAENDAVALYELFNEPATSACRTGNCANAEDWLVWKGFMETVIDVIRANDPDKIILVGGVMYAHDLSFAEDAPIADSNVAYAIHPYSVTPRDTWDAVFGNISAKYPVLPQNSVTTKASLQMSHTTTAFIIARQSLIISKSTT
jgi:endoglucanase